MKENKTLEKMLETIAEVFSESTSCFGLYEPKVPEKLVENIRKMFRKMSEALTFQLVKNKILDIESYEVWAYSIEIILLNGSILLGCLLISLMLGEITHMLSFVLFLYR